MATDRVTVSLDEESREALDDLVDRTGRGQSEIVRKALAFYATNYRAAGTDDGATLEQYHAVLSGGEHVLLDVDFLHGLLDVVDGEDGEPDEGFREVIDRVARYHATEYARRFDTLGDLLDWLAVCGFLTVREADAGTYHVVFPSEQVRWFMTEFVEKTARDLPFDVDISAGVSKVLMTEHPGD